MGGASEVNEVAAAGGVNGKRPEAVEEVAMEDAADAEDAATVKVDVAADVKVEVAVDMGDCDGGGKVIGGRVAAIT